MIGRGLLLAAILLSWQPPAVAQTIPEPQRAEIGRNMLVHNVDQALLGLGLSFDVFAQTTPLPPGPQGMLPSLVLFGFANKASVNVVVQATDLIASAKRVGFRSVHFLDKGSNGGWIFNLTNAGPYCSRGLCF